MSVWASDPFGDDDDDDENGDDDCLAVKMIMSSSYTVFYRDV